MNSVWQSILQRTTMYVEFLSSDHEILSLNSSNKFGIYVIGKDWTIVYIFSFSGAHGVFMVFDKENDHRNLYPEKPDIIFTCLHSNCWNQLP